MNVIICTFWNGYALDPYENLIAESLDPRIQRNLSTGLLVGCVRYCRFPFV